MIRTASIALTMSLLAITSANAKINVNYEEPESSAEQSARQAIEQSGANELVADLSNHYFPFNSELTISYGGDDGPLYDPSTHTVHMPYEFTTTPSSISLKTTTRNGLESQQKMAL
ncbi:hypothetical protein JCM19235_3734 [Vibrio maritimus]|uniref:Uncharacterized protein n=1 Tax=Vibrio maritimus TaxID=990268 RepID=A0A090SMV6_9VIBR|nr:hypothetical protein JCM19235_3734 [Vibrio maritimus]